MDKVKGITEAEMMAQLRGGKLSLPPLKIRLLEEEQGRGARRRYDALVEVLWRSENAQYMVEMKSLSTPKAFQSAVSAVRQVATEGRDVLPMVILPFLSGQQLRELEQQEMSGIDLCGNGVVTAPGKFSVFRTGNVNRFSMSAPIKNVYQKNSSMVGRVFLANPRFRAIQDILAEIRKRNLFARSWNKTSMTMGTVSKVVRSMEEDLIVGRGEGVRLLQPGKLLDKLSENFEVQRRSGTVCRQALLRGVGLQELLMKISQDLSIPMVATGLSSTFKYAVMERGEMLSIYCPDAKQVIERLPLGTSDRFPNIEIIETDDESVYFDAQPGSEFCWASQVQTYLELAAGDKRDRDTAEQIREQILFDLENVEW